MRVNIYFLLVTLILGGLTSCVSNRKVVPTSQLISVVNFEMEDLEYVGEISGEAVQSYVLGIPVGGKRNRYYAGSFTFPTYTNRRGFRNAMYDALMQQPDADFILPVGYTIETRRSFLGRKDFIKVKAKVFSLKTGE